MKQFAVYSKYCLLLLFMVIGICSIKAQGTTGFPYPQIPTMLVEPQQRANYLLMHYWDNVDFSDMTLVMNDDFMEQGFVDYLSVLPIVDNQTAENRLKR